MAFNYSEINLAALAAIPKECPNYEKHDAMKDVLLNMFWDGKIKTIHLGKMRWRLEPIVTNEKRASDEKEG